MSTDGQDRKPQLKQVDNGIDASNARWSFGGSVPDHFEEHIDRSVPCYRPNHDLIAQISDFFLHEGSTFIEIGCSTGALLRRVAEQHEGKSIKIIGIEIEPAMAAVARERCAPYSNIDIVEANAVEIDFEAADMIASYYTVQFVRSSVRQLLIDKIYKSLNWGGAFLLFEKVRGPDARFQDLLTTLYSDFKLEQGFTEEEIVNKTRSLKGILEPFSSEGNAGLLERAGFVDRMTVFRQLCFEGVLAIK
ncbi:MAG: methyltransferase domain-containing protein [Parvularcula sp.]|jgi:tRNA (cmo5U34)-methyltransferase|nr:methyltransferase domain-containing protein [Parvularcula sp.]